MRNEGGGFAANTYEAMPESSIPVTSDWHASSWHCHYLYFAALPYFYAPHHNFAFLISNFSFNRGFQA